MVLINPKQGIMISDIKVPWRGPDQISCTNSLLDAVRLVGGTLTPKLQLIQEVIFTGIVRFTAGFYSDLRRQRPYSIKVFHDNCKIRSSDVTRLRQDLATADPELPLCVLTKKGDIEIRNLRYLTSRFAVASPYTDEYDDSHDEIVHYPGQLSPGCFSHLMIAQLRCHDILHDDYGLTASKDEHVFALQMLYQLESASRIFNYLRETHTERRKRLHTFMEEVSIEKPLDRDSRVWKALNKVLDDIDEGRLPYIQDIRNGLDALPQEWKTDQFPYFSARASSFNYEFGFGDRRTNRCSFLQSVVEPNRHKDHPVYRLFYGESGYNTEAPPNTVRPLCKTIAIEQSKYNDRLIHIEENSTQDICLVAHRALARCLHRMDTDCTHDQLEGVLFGLRVTSQGFTREHGRPGVYAHDISSATDTISKEIGQLLVRRWFPPEFADFWSEINSQEAQLVIDGKFHPYVQRVGQKQGLLFSFGEFALCHHIMTLTAMKLAGMERIYANRVYRLLGDDHLMVDLSSNGRLLRSCYVESINFIGWKTNDKSLINEQGSLSYLVEFAKVTVHDGRISSPIPYKLASRCRGQSKASMLQKYSMLFWCVRSSYRITDAIKASLERDFRDTAERNYLDCLIFGGIVSQFSSIAEPHRFDEVTRLKALFAYLLTKVKGTFLQSFLSERALELFLFEDFQLSLDEIIQKVVPKCLDQYLALIEFPDKHKFTRFLDDCGVLHHSISRILGLTEDQEPIAGLLELSDQERGDISRLSQMYDDILSGYVDEARLVSFLRISHDLGTLDRFQLKSLQRHSGVEFRLISEAQKLAVKLFDTPEDSSGMRPL